MKKILGSFSFKLMIFDPVKLLWIILTLLLSVLFANCYEAHHWSVTKMHKVKINYTWTMANFSAFASNFPIGTYVSSSNFSSITAPDFIFSLHLFPNGKFSDGYVALYLNYESGPLRRINWRAQVKLGEANNAKLWNLTKSNQLIREGWGRKELLKTEDILNKTNNLLTEDGALSISVKVIFFADYVTSSANCRIAKTDNDFKEKILTGLSKYFSNKKYSDVILSSKGKKIHAHQIILSFMSPVLKSYLSQINKTVTTRPVYELDDINYGTLLEAVRFIYTGKVPKIKTMAKELLHAADVLEIKELRNLCETYYCEKLNVGNAYETFKLAKSHKAGELENRAAQFMALHLPDMARTKSFKEISSKEPSCVVAALNIPH